MEIINYISHKQTHFNKKSGFFIWWVIDLYYLCTSQTIKTKVMRVYVAEIPTNYDSINHLGLRSSLENEDIIPCYLTIGPGEIIAEDKDASNPIIFSYKYHSIPEYQADCEILELRKPNLSKSSVIILGSHPIGNSTTTKAIEELKAAGENVVLASDTHINDFPYRKLTIDDSEFKESEKCSLAVPKDGKAKRRERRKNNK